MQFNRYILMEQLRGTNKQCTVPDFAKATGYSERQISRWIAGEAKPPEAAIRKMADWFGLPLEAFTTSGELTPDEYDLIDHYRRLGRIDRARIMVYVADLAKGAQQVVGEAARTLDDLRSVAGRQPVTPRKKSGAG